MSSLHSVPPPVTFVPPTVAWPTRTLPARGLTLLEIDHESEALYASHHRAADGGTGWRDRYLAAKALCRRVYAERYPDYPMALEETHDANACLLYGRSIGETCGVLRVCFDSERGLPCEPSLCAELDTLRRAGIRVAEPGRFALPDGGARYRAFLRALYQVGLAAGVQLYLLQVRSEQAGFYRRNCAAIDLDGSPAPPGCVNLAWNLERTPKRFFRAFGTDQGHLARFLVAREASR